MPEQPILVVDDESAIRDSLKMTLEYKGYEFLGAATGQEALALAEREAPDLVLLDLALPDGDGVDLLKRLRNDGLALPILVITSATTAERVLGALRAGANGYLFKDDLDVRLRRQDVLQHVADHARVVDDEDLDLSRGGVHLKSSASPSIGPWKRRAP